MQPQREKQQLYSHKTYNNKSTIQFRRRNKKRGLLVVLIAFIAVFVGATVGTFVFLGALNSNFKSGIDDSLIQALQERPINEPFYILLMGTDKRKTNELDRSDSILLARVDTANKKTTIVSIPRDTKINIKGYGDQKINAAHSLDGGAAGSVRAVNQFAGVKISHYVEIDFNGFQGLVDALGGVEVDVPIEINDPDASIDGLGAGHVAKGLQVLNGESALIFCRSRATIIGDYQRQANQRMFLQALASKILSADPITLMASITSISEAVSTDLDVASIYSIASELSGMSTADIRTYTVPSSAQTINGISYVIPNKTEWKKMMQAIDSGNLPKEQPAWLSGVVSPEYQNRADGSTAPVGKKEKFTPSKINITVRNGGGFEGSAATASDLLKQAGYNVIELGNANQFVYEETLIVYKRTVKDVIVADVQNKIGKGTPIKDNGTYTFKGDILIICGADWKK